ncbi:MAG: hypothetical protein RIT45_1803 [Pseudomonadota bacterium]|jgi:hypothetical protein
MGEANGLAALQEPARAAAQADGRRALLALPGTVSGVALDAWAAQVRARYGEAVVARLRSDPAFSAAALPDAPRREQRLPIGLPTALTALLVEHALAGDWLALERPMVQDALARVATPTRLILRGLGVRRLLEGLPKLHASLYAPGHLEVEADDGSAQIRVVGSPLYAHPAWRLLQAFALRATVQLGTPAARAEIDSTAPAADVGAFLLRWRH